MIHAVANGVTELTSPLLNALHTLL